MPFELPELPYAVDALAPLLSADTLEVHHGKHHRAYVDKVNELVSGTAFAQATLRGIVQKSEGDLYNNAAQAWNHSFYWDCLAPLDSQEKPGEPFAERLKQDFGSPDDFKRAFRECALSLFGSGWTWLVKNEMGRLQIVNTGNAGNPLRNGLTPLLTCDLWEHSYYLDYRNERAKYVEAYLTLTNWHFASRCFERPESLKLFAAAPSTLSPGSAARAS